mmetsp:Transcript_13537/g.24449  ORF Transcript_13537/g.24449 Transcript_13537/m.24449 type:complete len:224 (-) Transcript_13537:622-1293(-)
MGLLAFKAFADNNIFPSIAFLLRVHLVPSIPIIRITCHHRIRIQCNPLIKHKHLPLIKPTVPILLHIAMYATTQMTHILHSTLFQHGAGLDTANSPRAIHEYFFVFERVGVLGAECGVEVGEGDGIWIEGWCWRFVFGRFCRFWLLIIFVGVIAAACVSCTGGVIWRNCVGVGMQKVSYGVLKRIPNINNHHLFLCCLFRIIIPCTITRRRRHHSSIILLGLH